LEVQHKKVAIKIWSRRGRRHYSCAPAFTRLSHLKLLTGS